MGRKRPAKRTPEQIKRDEFFRVVHLLNAVFGTLTCYDSWADVPQFRQLPQSHCHDCLTPMQSSCYPVCPWCGAKAG